jgi:hypothetical protein
LVEAVITETAGDSSFWSSMASRSLAAYLYAAARSGKDMRTVMRWIRGADPQEPEEVLTAAQTQLWSSCLGELRSGRNPQTAKSARLVMLAAADPS